MSKGVIYACSHRAGGNSDRAAELLARGVRDAGGKADILYLRDFEIRHCLACGFCEKATDRHDRTRCALGKKDQAWEAFAPLLTARTILFASPIYFYALPSRFKTWIDRSQQFWNAWHGKESWLADLPARSAHPVFVAGQRSGNKLFDGARLTLKYFVQNFNATLADPLVFRGLDQSDDLAAHDDFETDIIRLGRRAWEETL